MNVKYFPDTDTALIELSDKVVHETVEINDNILLDLDRDGKVVCMTIEQARENAKLPHFSYTEVVDQPVKQSA
ncbi:MAG TPA: DUF2283 domain-containing protein [Epsilonproteobacteria bacterium]|nr:DUF2283 domain-containing protein [Campylobacterota bacterium]